MIAEPGRHDRDRADDTLRAQAQLGRREFLEDFIWAALGALSTTVLGTSVYTSESSLLGLSVWSTTLLTMILLAVLLMLARQFFIEYRHLIEQRTLLRRAIRLNGEASQRNRELWADAEEALARLELEVEELARLDDEKFPELIEEAAGFYTELQQDTHEVLTEVTPVDEYEGLLARQEMLSMHLLNLLRREWEPQRRRIKDDLDALAEEIRRNKEAAEDGSHTGLRAS